MFRSALTRLRAVLELTDDLLGDPYDEPQSSTAQLHIAAHPHRQPLRWERSRRPGSVPAKPAHCLSPVRHGRTASETRDRDRDRVS
jgi:hypothetical protein